MVCLWWGSTNDAYWTHSWWQIKDKSQRGCKQSASKENKMRQASRRGILAIQWGQVPGGCSPALLPCFLTWGHQAHGLIPSMGVSLHPKMLPACTFYTWVVYPWVCVLCASPVFCPAPRSFQKRGTLHPVLWFAFVDFPPELIEMLSLKYHDPSLPLDLCPALWLEKHPTSPLAPGDRLDALICFQRCFIILQLGDGEKEYFTSLFSILLCDLDTLFSDP